MNDIQKSCVDAMKGRELEVGDNFKTWRAGESLPDLPAAPKVPEGASPTAHIPIINRPPPHPLGDDFEAVMSLITDVWQNSIERTREVEKLKVEIFNLNKTLNKKIKLDSGITRLQFDSAFESYFGQTQSKAKRFIAERLGL